MIDNFKKQKKKKKYLNDVLAAATKIAIFQAIHFRTLFFFLVPNVVINIFITKISIINYNFIINPMLFVLHFLIVSHNELIKY